MRTTATQGTLVSFAYRDRAIRFFVQNPNDVIQKQHLQGAFYEYEELSIIEHHFPKGGSLLDIGANVGNHTVFVGKFLEPSKITVIEPNPPAIRILETNIGINGLSGIVDTSHLGIGLGSESGTATAVFGQNNLGGSHMVLGDGDIPIRVGDAVLQGESYDFIKIDTESMEMDVLNGLEGLIERCKPLIFAEVDKQNAAAFNQWCEARGYKVLDRYRRYQHNENFLVGP